VLTDFQILFTDRFTDKYATKLSLTIAPHLKRVTALPCETSISKNYRKSEASIVINDKAQGSVATRLRCGGLFSNHFTMNLLLSLLVKEFLKSVNIWQSYREEVTKCPLIICKSILLQYLFFCVAADACSHTVGILAWPL